MNGANCEVPHCEVCCSIDDGNKKRGGGSEQDIKRNRQMAAKDQFS